MFFPLSPSLRYPILPSSPWSKQALNSPGPSPGLRLEYPCLKWAGVLSSGAAFHWLGLDWGEGLSAPVQGLRRESSFLYPPSPPWTRRSDLPQEAVAPT